MKNIAVTGLFQRSLFLFLLNDIQSMHSEWFLADNKGYSNYWIDNGV